jgi:arylsulfatase A-like enzyme
MRTSSVLLAIGLCVSATAAEPPDRPNVVVILADDLGYSDIGCYGGEIETPHLDKLAAGGIRFTQFYNTARCWPTRGALLTGFYAQQIRRDALPGIRSGGQGVRPKWARLLPNMLRPLGYRSYHSGKWHVDGHRLAGGFDRSYSLEDHNHYFGPRSHFEDDRKLPPAGKDVYVTTAITDHAIKCLKQHAEQSDEPFFSYVAFTAPHFPLHAIAADFARFRERYLRGWDETRLARYERMKSKELVNCPLSAPESNVGPPYPFPDALEKLGAGEISRPLPWSELTSEQKEFQAAKMAVHAAMVYRMDREIGRLIDQLRAMNALDNTLIFFLSDNGASAEIMVRGDGHDPSASAGSAASYLCLGPGWSTCANTPFRRHKTWVHEGGIATPLIVHWPKHIAARGELRHSPGHVIDLVPTILDAVGGKPLSKWEDAEVPPLAGKSLMPAFSADVAIDRDYLWWSHEGNRAIRVGDYKLVASGAQGAWELYNLASDRSESVNLAEKMPDKARELASLWEVKQDEFKTLATQDLPTVKP